MVVLGEICKRCNQRPTTLVSRNDAFCEMCFVRFIRGKQRKQMQAEKFKVKFTDKAKKPNVLFDMQNNHQSYVLLDIIISMLQEQLTQGPKALRGFNLIVCTINNNNELPVDAEKLKDFYTSKELERLGIEFVEVDCNSYVKDNKLEHLRLDLESFTTFVRPNHNIDLSGISTYDELLSQAADKSTREDLSRIINEDILFQTAKDQMCTILIKPDSMTQMAVDILSDTIRGRGSEIPLKSQDSVIPITKSENFEILHPLKDVLNSEIKMYAKALSLNQLSPNLQNEVSSSDISNKNKTVGQLVGEYFTSLEVEYPETVSTVVKIGAKLSNDSKIAVNHCAICKVPIYHDPKLWLEQITVPGCVAPQNDEERTNLQMYLDSVKNTDDNLNDEADSDTLGEIKICYGCMVTLGVSKVTNFDWPQRPTREEILSEYILGSDDDV